MKRLHKGAKNVDTTLRERRAINDLLTRTAAPGVSRADLEEIGDRLFRLGDQIVPAIVRKLEETDDEEAVARLAFLIEYLDNEAFVEPLVDLLLSRRKSDRAKASLLAALQAYSVDTADPLFANIFERPEVALAHTAARLVEEAETSGEPAICFLESFFGYARPHKLALIRELARLPDPRAIRYLELLADHEDEELATRAVDMLGRVRSREAVEALVRIAERHPERSRRARAERSIRRLAFAGLSEAAAARSAASRRALVDPPGAAPSPYSGRGRPRLGPLYKVHVARIDGSGGRSLWLARRRGAGADPQELTAVCLLLDDEIGLKDGFGYDEIARSEYDALVRKARKEEVLVESDYRYAVALLRDALARNVANELPYPPHFLLLKRFFGETDLSPAPYTAVFPEYDGAALLDDLPALAETGGLLDRDELDGWLLATGRVYDFADEVRRLKEESSRKAFVRRSLDIYRRFFEELVQPRLPRYRDRLRLTADLLRRVGGRRRDVYLALVAAAHLDAAIQRQPRVPVSDQPFVHRLIFESLDLAVSALDDGYDPRREPEDAD